MASAVCRVCRTLLYRSGVGEAEELLKSRFGARCKKSESRRSHQSRQLVLILGALEQLRLRTARGKTRTECFSCLCSHHIAHLPGSDSSSCGLRNGRPTSSSTCQLAEIGSKERSEGDETPGQLHLLCHRRMARLQSLQVPAATNDPLMQAGQMESCRGIRT